MDLLGLGDEGVSPSECLGTGLVRDRFGLEAGGAISFFKENGESRPFPVPPPVISAMRA